MRGHQQKNNTLLLACFLVVLTPLCVHADLRVTEIMYDPPGNDSDREWLELYNTGSSTVSLAGDKIRIGGKNHPIEGSSTVLAHGYTIIAQEGAAFLSEYVCTVPIANAQFSLPNSSAYVSIVNASGTEIVGALYKKQLGASNDGNSLQWSDEDGAYRPRSPTPGSTIGTNIIRPDTTTAQTILKSHTLRSTRSRTSKITKTTNDNATGASTPDAAVESSSSSDPHTESTTSHWGLYLAIALASASILGLVIEGVRAIKKDEWDIIDAGE